MLRRIMKKIKLTNSDKTAAVDDEDFSWLNQFEWYMDKDGYAVTDLNGEPVEMGYMVIKNAEKHGRLQPDGSIA